MLYDRFCVNKSNFTWSYTVTSLIQTMVSSSRIWRPLSCGQRSCMYLSFGLHRQHDSSLNKHREYVWKGTVFPNAMFTYLYSLFAATCDCLKSHRVCASCYTFVPSTLSWCCSSPSVSMYLTEFFSSQLILVAKFTVYRHWTLLLKGF